MGDSMYNEEIKRKFLEEFDPKQSRGGGPTAFMQKIGPYEESIGKDIAEMTTQEAQKTILSAKFREYSVLRLAMSVFRKYSEWCITNNMFSDMPDGVRSLKAKDFDLSDGLAENAFKNEEEFFNTLKAIYSFEDGLADVPYLALAWAGLKKKEIIELLDSEIDLDNRVILNHDGTIMIPWFSVAVFDALRGKNYGKKLVFEILNNAKEMGAKEVFISAKNHGFFKALGFKDGTPKNLDLNADCLDCEQYMNGCRPVVMKIDI